MYVKFTTALLVGLVHSAALNLSPRQEPSVDLLCFGDCGADTVVSHFGNQ